MNKKDYQKGFFDGVIDGGIEVIETLENLKDEIEADELNIEEIILLLKNEMEYKEIDKSDWSKEDIFRILKEDLEKNIEREEQEIESKYGDKQYQRGLVSGLKIALHLVRLLDPNDELEV